jgi:ABC-type branched-subunit amino acid transport system substrate-binding protein
MVRKTLLVFFIVSLAVGLVGGGAAAQDEPIRIGLLQDLSGWLAVYGVESVNGFELGLLYAAGIDPTEYDSIDAALADVTVAGRPVEIVVKDYGSENAQADADNAAAGARELIESEFVDVIYGVPNSGAAIAL